MKKVTTSAGVVRVSKRVEQLIELLASGAVRTQKEACERIGLSRSYACRILGKRQFQELLTQHAAQTLRLGLPRASRKMVDLVDSPSQKVAFEASAHVMRLGGFVPPQDPRAQVNVSITNNTGFPGGTIDSRTPLEVRRWMEEQAALNSAGYLIRLDRADDVIEAEPADNVIALPSASQNKKQSRDNE